MKGYIDLFVLPVPKKNLKKYCAISTRFGKMMREYGALEYREFIGDDLKPKGVVPFPMVIALRSGEVLVSAVVGYKTKAHRDQINKKVQSDPRTKKMVEDMMQNPVADHKRMCYGGFATIVNP
ncbi:DUF1428 domain-containing protein [Candidatus Woesearchaeota archaeon]|nr:DUF1428 domain-containing protein [Candidatus Woesearchaeota archaeon]